MPSLSSRVVLSDYAKKIAINATNIFLTKKEIDVGHAAIYNDAGFKAFVSSFCIDRDYQRTKLGNMLMLEVVRCCSDMQIDQVELAVALHNTRAYFFYLKHGFSKVKEDGESIFMLKIIHRDIS